MWTQFFLQNLHFAVNIFTAMIFSWAFWLYFDVWLIRKDLRGALKFLGFLLLSLSFVVHSIHVGSTTFTNLFLSDVTQETLLVFTRLLGYFLLCAGLFSDPITAHPLKDKKSPNLAIMAMGFSIPLLTLGKMFFPIGASLVGLLFLYKATHGLEFHLRRPAYAFFTFAVYELLSLSELFQESTNIAIFKAVSAFSPIWIVSHLILFFGSLLIAKWVFAYLLKRLQTQLYIFFSVAILLIFIISTLTFSSLILRNMQSQAIEQLTTSVAVLEFAINSKKDELISDTQVFGQKESLIEAISLGDNSALARVSQEFLLTKKMSFLVVVDAVGQVIARGEEPERIGDSLSENILIKRSYLGDSVASTVVRDGVLAPQVLISAGSPIKEGDELIGAVLGGISIDNAFVDGVKRATSLTSSVYGQDRVSATTLLSEDGVTRKEGIVETNSEIVKKVLGQGENYSGTSSFVNTPYFVAYLPLKDIDGVPVGMLFVGQPQVKVLQAAGYSIQLTFLVAGVMWLFAIVPSYLISAYISKQIK